MLGKTVNGCFLVILSTLNAISIIPCSSALNVNDAVIIDRLYMGAKNTSTGFVNDVSNDDVTSLPLILTPLIEKREIQAARNLSRVEGLFNDTESYTGFITVNKKFNSNLFFWFFPSAESTPDSPLLLWLQGGPGSSSMLGLFVEHGPFYLNEKLELKKRKYSWNLKYNVLYVDNPAGTGFSFTNNDQGYARNQTDVAINMYSFLQQFLQLFPEYRKVDFYVTGESYGGKYVPSVAFYIHEMNRKVNERARINLKGISIGNGLSDPKTQFDYGEFLYQIGLADKSQLEYIEGETEAAGKLINETEWLKAFRVFDELINGDKFQYPTYFKNITGLNYYLNYQLTDQPADLTYFTKYLNQKYVREAIHVGNLPFHNSSEVESHLLEDIMKSVKPWLATLMDNYKVLIYSGNMDIIVPTSSTDKLVSTTEWKHAKQFEDSNREVYKVHKTDTQVAGYVKNFDKFFFVVLRNAGHLVPFDQPAAAYDMITRFVDGRSFKN